MQSYRHTNYGKERNDNFGETSSVALNSDSDVPFSGGVPWETPVEGLEVFAGYAENFKAIADGSLRYRDAG